MKNVNVAVDNSAIQKGAKLTHYNGESVGQVNKTPTLVQNDVGAYKWLPAYLALQLEKQGKVVIMKLTDPDYLTGWKLAVGIFEGFKAGEVIQMKGKAVRPEDIGRLDVKSMLAEAEAEVAAALAGAKSKGEVVGVKELPPGLQAFDDKLRARRLRRGED